MSKVTADWITPIEDEELDPRRLISAIRQASPHKQIVFEVQGLQYPVHPTHRYPGKPDDLPYDLALHHHIVTARAIESGDAGGQLSAFLSRLPLLGPIWDRIHRVMARLLLPFLGQRSMNHNLLGAVERLVAENQVQSRQILALKAELEALRERDE